MIASTPRGHFTRPWWRVILVAALILSTAPLSAQFQMPDPKQMSGIPRPVNDLPDGTVSVRLIRGSLSNNLTNFPVELYVAGKPRTVKTDDGGRAEFGNLPAGATLKAVADVDGEHLESEEFPAPGQGGIRLMLVATDTSKGATTEPNAPAVAGQVILGGQTRIIVEPEEEGLSLYYLLDIENTGRVPVNPGTAFIFEMPAGAVGTGLLEGSSPRAIVNGRRVTVAPPFAPGGTLVQVACRLPVSSASLEFSQRFPAGLQQLAIIVKKLGDTKLSSAQVASQREMTASGETFIAATGGPVSAGQAIVVGIDNLPHHSSAPRWIALSLAAAFIIGGVWISHRPDDGKDATEHRRLVARREKLLNELVRLEHDQQAGKIPDAKYRSRREELLSALEHVYGVLDDPGIAA